MRFFHENGLVVQNGCKIAIDSTKPQNAELAVITHAHSDHVFSGKSFGGKFLASEETAALLKGKMGECCFDARKFKDSMEIGESKVSLENSGHILGSSQVIVEGDKKAVITSDFQLKEGLLLPKAEMHDCDVLVIESTFGKPCFSFPERQEVYEDIGKWVSQNSREGKFSVLAGYSLGKAQELCKVLAEYSAEIPAVHEKVFDFNKVYESFGVDVGKFEKIGNNLKEFNAAIIPPTLAGKGFVQALQISLGRKVVSGIATGWGFYSKTFDKSFPLSDHADFSQLLEYAEQSGAKRIFTMHGFSKELARHLSRKGHNASALCDKGQKSLSEFIE